MQRQHPSAQARPKFPVSSYRHETGAWTVRRPLSSTQWACTPSWPTPGAEAKDIEGHRAQDYDRADVYQALANILFARLPQLVAMLGMLGRSMRTGRFAMSNTTVNRDGWGISRGTAAGKFEPCTGNVASLD